MLLKNKRRAIKMPQKGKPLTEKEKAALDAAREKSRSPESRKKRAASLAVSNAIKGNLGFSGRLTPLVEDYLRNVLITPDKNGKTYLYNFIDEFLKQAKDDPGSRAGQMFASAIFSSELLSKLDEEANKQMQKDLEFTRYRIRSTLFDKQTELFDNETDQTIEVICTRRAGKTECNARLCAKGALKPNHHVLYLNRSFDNAVNQIGQPLEELLAKLDMKHSGQIGAGRITFDNGSSITVGGYNNKGDIDRYRGFHYSLIILDEISHLRNPRQLLKEVLEPAMVDYGKEAQLILSGTPPRVKANYAYELWHNPKIKHYAWSFMDNPFIPDKEDAIKRICDKHGVTVDAPFIQREYFGNMEAFDEDCLVFRGYKTKDELPKGVTFSNAYIGVDFGFEDKNAVISGVVYNKQLYIIEQHSEAHESVSDLCNEVKRQWDNLLKLPLQKQPWVIVDTNNKEAAYELQKTYKIPNVYCAYKYNKDLAIDQLAEFMRTEKIYIPSKGILQFEAENTIWKRDEDTDEILHELADDEFHPNALMALLYISRIFAVHVLNITDINKDALKGILEG